MAATTISPSPPAPNNYTIVEKIDEIPASGLLKFCTNMREVKQAHCQMARRGLTHIPKLVAAYTRIASPESLDYATKAFELLVQEGKANPFLWNSLIRGFSSTGSIDEAFELYLLMVSRGIMPNRFTFPPLLAASAKVLAFMEGVQLHGFLIKKGLAGDLFIQNSLIHLYSECGEMDYAQKVFDGMGDRNVVSWTSLIDGYAHGDYPQKAVSLFYDMVRESGIIPNSFTMACVVSACAKSQDLDLGERIRDYIIASGIGLSLTLANSLVDMYMKCGAVEAAEQLFSECTDRSIVLWNTMVLNYARQGMAKDALVVFDKMLGSGLRPDRVTAAAVMSALAQLGAITSGRQLHGIYCGMGWMVGIL